MDIPPYDAVVTPIVRYSEVDVAPGEVVLDAVTILSMDQSLYAVRQQHDGLTETLVHQGDSHGVVPMYERVGCVIPMPVPECTVNRPIVPAKGTNGLGDVHVLSPLPLYFRAR